MLLFDKFWMMISIIESFVFQLHFYWSYYKCTVECGDSMVFKISWAAERWRPGTVWFRSVMVLSRKINYQEFGEIITKWFIFTFNFESVLFRKTKSRQIFDTWFHNQGQSWYRISNDLPTLFSGKYLTLVSWNGLPRI